MDRLTRALAIALESLGCAVIVAGIMVETMMHADTGFILITAGSLAIATGSLLFVKVVRKL